jgi:hypothetical protein
MEAPAARAAFLGQALQQSGDLAAVPRRRVVRQGPGARLHRHPASELGICPIYHHLRESIEAHLSIVVAAMAVSHYIEAQTGWSIKKFVRTTRRYRTVKIKVGNQTLTAADPLPDDLHAALIKIRADGAH